MATSIDMVNEQTRATFVAKPVKEDAITKFVIDNLMPYFPKGNRVIGGLVDESNQYWKANFHWEYLLKHLDKAAEMDIDANYKKAIAAIRASITTNKPNPEKGYLASRKMGDPKDTTGRDQCIRRWRLVRQAKKDFKSVIDNSGMLKGMDKSGTAYKGWMLSISPVAKPGKSKHSTGYAVDIRGNTSDIIRIANGLGASWVFPEPSAKNCSHVHCEFAKGVGGKPLPKTGPLPSAPVEVGDPHYTENACLLTPSELAQLKHDVLMAAATNAFADVVAFPEVLKHLFDEIVEDWWWR